MTAARHAAKVRLRDLEPLRWLVTMAVGPLGVFVAAATGALVVGVMHGLWQLPVAVALAGALVVAVRRMVAMSRPVHRATVPDWPTKDIDATVRFPVVKQGKENW